MLTPVSVPQRRGLVWDADGRAAIRVWSHAASTVSVCRLDPVDPTWVLDETPLQRTGDDWSGDVPTLRPGDLYAIRADGPRASFVPSALLLDPYAGAVMHSGHHAWQSVALPPDDFDWQHVHRPQIPLDRVVVYEAHVKGLTARMPQIPSEIRGSYAALAHPALIEHLVELGITTLELLPIHAFATEPRLRALGLTNYWGYNTVAFFAPHPRYGSPQAQQEGPAVIVNELKTAIRELHRAGIQVLLDVVYNHTAEGTKNGPTFGLRGLDEAAYYRVDANGEYIDTTGCGNTIDAASPVVQELILDSLRHWVDEYHVDGFRFDLAAALGRDENAVFQPDHPLLRGIAEDPKLAGRLLIAEPWDIGMGGWQSGGFRAPWSEWNDHFRDDVRTFWLSDVAASRRQGTIRGSVGRVADALAGSERVFGAQRGPLSGVNFVTAHDGFTLRDLVSFSTKHNRANGESNRDGTENNHSFGFGAEGPTSDEHVLTVRRRAARDLMATLLLSAGIPMITAGDEMLRTQNGNNNAYCLDSPLTWLPWEWTPESSAFRDTIATLIRLRAENPALRPIRFGVRDRVTPSASRMEWYDASGHGMRLEDWSNTGVRTLQFYAESTPENEALNRTLTVLHGSEDPTSVKLPAPDGIGAYLLLWDSSWERPPEPAEPTRRRPGDAVDVPGLTVQLYRAE